MIRFDSDTYQAEYAGQSIRLLPKEFALLRYLYEHSGRSFARDELLDAVWPLEAPGDRTVDDHIYRVRKKLTPWSHILRLETIRGQGYKLTRLAPRERLNPLLQDEQFVADANRMLVKYHGMGMGAAMQLLSANRDVLGLPGDPFYDAYVRFVSGDFAWLLETEGIAPLQQAVYAAFIHASVQFDALASLPYFEKLIAQGEELTTAWLSDLQLNAAYLSLAAGYPQQARERLDDIRAEIAALDSPSFTALFLLKEAMVSMEENDSEATTAKLAECEALLERHPIRRERGAYLVTKGLDLYRQSAPSLARQTIAEGVELTRETQFIPHLLHSLQLIVRHLEKYAYDSVCLQDYRRQWDAMAEHHRFPELLSKAKRLLDSRL